MKPKILLIEPPFYRLHKNSYSLDRIPFGLAYLAGSILENTSWDVKVYNTDFIPSIKRKKISFLAGEGFDNYVKNLNDLSGKVWSEVKEIIKEYKPDVVGVSVKSATYISAQNVAKIVKELDSNIKIIFGGPHPTMAKDEIFKNPYVDFTVLGEGEITIAELLKSIQIESVPNDVKGIMFRHNGGIIKTQARKYIKNLDSLSYPHHIAKKVLHDYEKYPTNSFKYIFASRGCPYNCHFCASKEIWTRSVRFRTVENVIDEIKGIRNNGIKRLHFDDDTFGVNKKYIKELCSEIKNEVPDIKWSCEIRADLIDDEIVLAMKQAGCETIQVGFESGNDELLRLMGKGLKVNEILTACKTIKKHKIELQTFFLVGYPYETEEMLKDTVKMMKKSKSDKILYSIFTPYPHTELYDFCKSKGLIKENFDPTLYNHQSPLNCFSMYISPERFRVLATKIERMIDRRNLLNRIGSLFLLKGFPRLSEVIHERLRKHKINNKNKETFPEGRKIQLSNLSSSG